MKETKFPKQSASAIFYLFMGLLFFSLGLANAEVVAPGTLQFSTDQFQRDEDKGTARITVSRMNGTDGRVTVRFAASQVTGQPKEVTAKTKYDFEETSGLLVWENGDSTNKFFNITLYDDDIAENPKTVQLALTNPTGGATLGTPAEGILTILDVEPSSPLLTIIYGTAEGTFVPGSPVTITADQAAAGKTFDRWVSDEITVPNATSPTTTIPMPTTETTVTAYYRALRPGTLQFSTGQYQRDEDKGSAKIAVSRMNGADGRVTVRFGASGLTAKSKFDFEETSGLLVWENGDTTDKFFDVTLYDDIIYEGQETVFLVLVDPTGGAILGDPAQATLTIGDDELPPNPNVLTRRITSAGDTLTLSPNLNMPQIFPGPSPIGRSFTLEILEDTFLQDVMLTFEVTADLDPSHQANLIGTGVGFKITLDNNEDNNDLQPLKLVTFTYQEFIALPIILPSALDQDSRLVLARFDQDTNTWLELDTTVDGSRLTVPLNHFSTFQVMRVPQVVDPQSISPKMFPNPFKPGLHAQGISFENLDPNSSVKIYTLLGEQVAERTTNASGQASWDGTNESGQPIASGVYFVRTSGKTLKLAVQR